MQNDPLGLVDGANAYAYVANNPNYYADPTGLVKIRDIPGGEGDAAMTKANS